MATVKGGRDVRPLNKTNVKAMEKKGEAKGQGKKAPAPVGKADGSKMPKNPVKVKK